jgi:hypothetical protein
MPRPAALAAALVALASPALPRAAGAEDMVRCRLGGEVLVYAEVAWCETRGGDSIGRFRPVQKREPGAGTDTATPVSDPASFAAAQEALRDLGFDPGPIDGLWGPRSRAALRAFLKSRDLEGGEHLDEAVWSALRKATRDRSSPAGAGSGLASPDGNG